MKIPFLDLKRGYDKRIESGVIRVMRSGKYILGPEVESLEKLFADCCGVPFAIAVSSGTDALLVSLMTMNIGLNNSVITTPFTFFATVGAIARVGARPIFVDIDQETFNINQTKILTCKDYKKSIIMPVHLFGQMARLDLIDQNKHILIEDAAQSIGSEYNGQKAGTIGKIGCFSFFPSKNIGCFGDAGMVITKSEDIYNKIKTLRNHGAMPKYYHKHIGGNFRMDTIQAAILLYKIKNINKINNDRIENAMEYNRILKDINEIRLPYVQNGAKHVYNQYCVLVKNRNKLKEYLKNNGIETEVYYPLPMHEQKCFKYLGYKHGDFPVSEYVSNHILALPIYPGLKPIELKFICNKIRDFYEM